MKGSHCRLYDENLVRNIMISTGVSIMEFVRKNKSVDTEEVCEYIEFNADDIIAETIKNLSSDENEFDGLGDSINKPIRDDDDDEESEQLW